MKLETLIALAAVAGVAYLVWDRYADRVARAAYEPVYSTRPVRVGVAQNGGVRATPEMAPPLTHSHIAPNCQTPCPPGVGCAQALDGVWIGGGAGDGTGDGTARCVPITRLIPQ